MDLNFNRISKIAEADFLHLGKIIYIVKKLKKKSIFVKIHATRSDISFAKRDKYTIFKLKCSKINLNYFAV